MTEKIPIIICIHVEPDEHFINKHEILPWQGYEGCYEFWRSLRSRLAAATGSPVHFSWLFRMDPQIAETYGYPEWGVTNYPQYIDDFKKNGDEIGLHNHAYRWEERIHEWIVDYGNQEWINYCVQTSFNAFKDVLHYNCESFNFSDSWMSNTTMNLLEDLGTKFELTLEPGQKARHIFSIYSDKRFTGFLPDYTQVPRYPYRPAKHDYRIPDPTRQKGIWVIPVSTDNPFIESESIKVPILAINFACSLSTFARRMEYVLNNLENPYLVLLMRSSLVNYKLGIKNLLGNFAYILSHPNVKNFVFTTPQEALNVLGY